MKKITCLLLATATRLAAQVAVEQASPAAPELAVFGGGEATLRLRVEALAHADVSVVYDLLQFGGSSLAAPIVSNQSAAKGPMGNAVSRTVEVRVPVPEVKRPARMLARFRIAGSSPFGKPVIDYVFLDVFPCPAPSEWRVSLAADEARDGRRIAVFCESPRVRAFFEKNAIAFQDLGPDLPEKFPPDVLAVGEVAPDVFERHRPEPGPGRQIFFLDDPLVLPGTYEIRVPGGIFTKVTLPIPAGLADNPKAQASFIDLLHRNLEPATP